MDKPNQHVVQHSFQSSQALYIRPNPNESSRWVQCVQGQTEEAFLPFITPHQKYDLNRPLWFFTNGSAVLAVCNGIVEKHIEQVWHLPVHLALIMKSGCAQKVRGEISINGIRPVSTNDVFDTAQYDQDTAQYDQGSLTIARTDPNDRCIVRTFGCAKWSFAPIEVTLEQGTCIQINKSEKECPNESVIVLEGEAHVFETGECPVVLVHDSPVQKMKLHRQQQDIVVDSLYGCRLMLNTQRDVSFRMDKMATTLAQTAFRFSNRPLIVVSSDWQVLEQFMLYARQPLPEVISCFAMSERDPILIGRDDLWFRWEENQTLEQFGDFGVKSQPIFFVWQQFHSADIVPMLCRSVKNPLVLVCGDDRLVSTLMSIAEVVTLPFARNPFVMGSQFEEVLLSWEQLSSVHLVKRGVPASALPLGKRPKLESHVDQLNQSDLIANRWRRFLGTFSLDPLDKLSPISGLVTSVNTENGLVAFRWLPKVPREAPIHLVTFEK